MVKTVKICDIYDECISSQIQEFEWNAVTSGIYLKFGSVNLEDYDLNNFITYIENLDDRTPKNYETIFYPLNYHKNINCRKIQEKLSKYVVSENEDY